MSGYEVAAAAGAIAFVAAGLAIAVAARTPGPAWAAPALLSAGFLCWSIGTVAAEGPTGFWTLHTADSWGVQVWWDLLLAAGTAWFLLQSRMRELGMPRVPWFLAIAASGSIALLALVAIVLRRSATGRVEQAATGA